ncbi:hypothetical protein BDZ90DRAFT_263050 [Jaminaea rosea]|uniref:Myb-like domain-containing protein n=1 Tax=Jaminaea rosea TaxID=1569628 RepID=A0A316UIZ5_9BASI|nr:hypothetical protein BDZ90DRAFT_263050 [Jaminaea rosea]PWN24838.1 hypothetical protein BDZ90DRAFT_263050 [Jaminaea rosea]
MASFPRGATLSELLEKRHRLSLALESNTRLQSSLCHAIEDLPRSLVELSQVESVLDLAEELHTSDIAERSIVSTSTHSSSLPILGARLPAVAQVNKELHDLREVTCRPAWNKVDDTALRRCVEAECKRLAAYEAAKLRNPDPLGYVASLSDEQLARCALGPGFDWHSLALRIAPKGSTPAHTGAACSTRWIMSVQKGPPSKMTLSPEQEAELRKLVNAQGSRIDWHHVASQLVATHPSLPVLEAHDALYSYTRLLPDQDEEMENHAAIDDQELLRLISVFGFEWAILAERTRKRRSAVWDRFRRALKNTHTRGIWNEGELQRLRQGIEEQLATGEVGGDLEKVDWTRVSILVGKRTPAQCRMRWKKRGARIPWATKSGEQPETNGEPASATATTSSSSSAAAPPRGKSVRWTLDEDERLKAAIAQSDLQAAQPGKKHWSWQEIAKFVGGRTALQASERWRTKLQQEVAGGVARRIDRSGVKVGGGKRRSGRKRKRVKDEESESEQEGDEEKEEDAEEEEDAEDIAAGTPTETQADSNDSNAEDVEVLLPPTTSSSRRGRKRKSPLRNAEEGYAVPRRYITRRRRG